MMAVCVLAGTMAIGGTMAYLTDKDAAVNTFTIGEVKADLIEPNYPGNDSDQVKELVPNEEVKKDPQVVNTGTNDMLVFMTVEVPTANVTVVEDDGTKGEKKVTDLFWLKQDEPGEFHENSFDEAWMMLEDKGNVSETERTASKYVFGYTKAVPKGGTTEPLFDKVQLKNIIENEVAAGEPLNILLTVYAIQASSILNDNIDLTGELSKENLGMIYDIYLNQSGLEDSTQASLEDSTQTSLEDSTQSVSENGNI